MTEIGDVRLIQLRASNYMGLVHVNTRFIGGLNEVTGENGNGKTSFVNAIANALRGQKGDPEDPIRHGEESANVEIDLGSIVVRRRWSAAGRAETVVESAEGVRLRSPQAILDDLYGHMLDPIAFSKMSPRQQAETLRQLTGLDTRELDARKQEAYDERTTWNRKAREAEGQTKLLRTGWDDNTPDVEQSVAELAAEMKSRSDERQVNDAVRADLRSCSEELAERRANVKSLREQIARLEREYVASEKRAEELAKEETERKAEVADLVDPDLDEIKQRLEQAETVNKAVRRKADWQAKVNEQQSYETKAGALTGEIEAIERRKEQMLASAKMPIRGLSIDGDVVLFDGVPYSQIAESAKLKVGMAIGAALNPKLKLLLVPEGSLLDRKQREVVAQWCLDHDVQTVMARAAVGDERCGIIIEDGEVVGAEA